MLNIQIFTFNPFQENSYLIADADKNCVIIDPGCSNREENSVLENYIESRGLKVLALLNTHAHIDHIFGNHWVMEKYQVPFYLHKEDLPVLKNASRAADMYGIQGFIDSPDPTHELTDGMILNFGAISFKVLFTPGHAPGHVVFYNEAENFVINGDVLFKNSFGRTDLPGGNFEQLKKSITETMFSLPDQTIVFSGHGPSTSIGDEKENNPMLKY